MVGVTLLTILLLRNSKDIGEAVSETVETLERTGGKHAFAHIKHCIPTCEVVFWKRELELPP